MAYNANYSFGTNLRATENKELEDDDLQPISELIDLEDWQCKWPYEGLMCCGRARLLGKPYCETHYSRVTRGSHGLRNPEVYTKHKKESEKKPKPRPLSSILIEDIG